MKFRDLDGLVRGPPELLLRLGLLPATIRSVGYLRDLQPELAFTRYGLHTIFVQSPGGHTSDHSVASGMICETLSVLESGLLKL